MKTHKCEKRVYSSGSFNGHSCGKTAKVCHEGRWLCGMHSPEAQAKRDKKSKERLKEHLEDLSKRNQKHYNLQEVIKVLDKWHLAQTMHNTADLYNAATVYFGRVPVIPD